jgi:hypothetical protein
MASSPALTASYSAPSSDAKVFSQTLPACSNEPSATERTTSLTALRNAISDTQDQINAFLTQKMDEDVKKAGVASVDDATFEENYGEDATEQDG